MPIINREDAAEVEAYIGRAFAVSPGERAEVLRQMFVEMLDFTRASGVVSLAGAPAAVTLPPQAERLATMDGVNVVYVALDIEGTDRLRKSEAAAAAKQVSNALGDDLLLVLTNTSGSQLHFILPSFETATPYLRRMVVERDVRRRTVVMQISNIYWRWKDSGNIHTVLEEAFDVEAVTKEFFAEYKSVFDYAMEQVTGFGAGEEESESKKLFVQTMFNRLMFVYFVSRKGWLRYDDDRDYLNALWRAHHRSSDDDSTFYTDRLRLLFFAGLNNEKSLDLNDNADARRLIGVVP